MSESPQPPQRRRFSRSRAVAVNLAVAMGLLFVVTFLPPDNSLAEVQKSGVLRVCLPEAAPPLVTTDAAHPGYDVELLQQIAADLGVRLAINRSPAIGADFNPRNWRLTRAQCQVIAGGVVDNAATRGFLQLLPTEGSNGWASMSRNDIMPQRGDAVAVFPGPSSLDRLALSRFLRAEGLQILPVNSSGELVAALASGQAKLAISDWLTLASLDVPEARIDWLSPSQLGHFQLAFGLWKGDATLMRAMRESMGKLAVNGVQDDIASRYKLPDSR